MNIAFFGTSDRSIPILKSLKNNYNLKLVITKKDSKFGRKQTLKPTEVKVWAQENDVEIFEIENFKEQKLILETLINARQIQLAVVADFSFMIPESTINTLPYGVINIHFALLPKLRGASPVQHAILNDEEFTGVTYYLMDKGMDTGKIIYQFEHKINPNLNSADLYQEMFQEAAAQLKSVIVDYINKTLVPRKQDHTKATYTYSPTHPKNTFIYKEDAKIDWTQSKRSIFRVIKAYSPWPVAWTTFNEIILSELIEDYEIKTNIKPTLKIKINDADFIENRLIIKTVTVEGYKQMEFREFLNGFFVKIKQ